MDTPIDGPEQSIHLLIGWRHRLVEPQDPALLDIDAVEHERMDVDVQIQGGAEALNDRHGPPRPTGTPACRARRGRNPSTARTKTDCRLQR